MTSADSHKHDSPTEKPGHVPCGDDEVSLCETSGEEGSSSQDFPFAKIGVLVTTKDRPELLERQLLAILGQTFRDFQVMVIDDASGTMGEVLDRVGPKFDEAGIILEGVELEKSLGTPARPRNVGYQLLETEWIATSDDDDLWFPNHLETLIGAAEGAEETSPDIVYGTFILRVPDGLEGMPVKDGTKFPFVHFNPFQLMAGPTFNFISSHTLQNKGRVTEKLSEAPWPEEVPKHEDWAFYAQGARAGLAFLGVDVPTFEYWWHGGNYQLTKNAGMTEEDLNENRKGGLRQWKGSESFR